VANLGLALIKLRHTSTRAEKSAVTNYYMNKETGKVSIAQLVSAFKEQRTAAHTERAKQQANKREERALLYKNQTASLKTLLPAIQEVFALGPGNSAIVFFNEGREDTYADGIVELLEPSICVQFDIKHTHRSKPSGAGFDIRCAYTPTGPKANFVCDTNRFSIKPSNCSNRGGFGMAELWKHYALPQQDMVVVLARYVGQAAADGNYFYPRRDK